MRMRGVAGRISISVAIVLALAGFVFGASRLWPLALDPKTGPALSAFSTALSAGIGLVAAVASAFAAVAAMRAARQSDETSRHALEALGLAMEPTLDARFVDVTDGAHPDSPRERLTVWNKSRWKAVDVEVEVEPAYGPRAVHRVDQLEPWCDELDVWFAHPMPGKPPLLDDPNWRGELEWVDRMRVRYSDERASLRWELNLDMAYSAHRSDQMSGEGSGPADGHGSITRVR